MPEAALNASHKSVIVGGVVGNIMEWYDFAVYGYFAPILAPKFFPTGDAATSLVAAFGAFAAGFLMRPVGGVLFGHIGDRIGRKAALTLSVAMMAVPSVLIGFLPTHESIGVMAAVLLVALRMIQGLSVGGEYTTSIVFLVEHGPQHRRGFMGSFSGFGSVAGALLGSGLGALLNAVLTPEQVGSWGWRLAFILGLGVGLGALLVRRGIPETPVPADQEDSRSPVVKAVRNEWKSIVQTLGSLMVYAVGYYVIFLYLTTFLIERVHVPAWEAMEINTVSMVVLMALIPVMAHLSDKIGRKPLLLFASIGLVLFSYPFIYLMHQPEYWHMQLGQIGFAVFVAAYAGVNPATMVEGFPADVRCSGMSFSFNLSFAVFGGTAPMVAAWLIGRTHDDFSVAWFLIVAAAISAVSVLVSDETAHEPIETYQDLIDNNDAPALATEKARA